MSKSTVVIGFSVSPTHVSAVRMSTTDFTVELQAHKTLPPATLSHDAKRLLDAPTLVPIIRDMMAQLGNPQFTDPVYLSIYTPFLATREVAMAQVGSLRTELQDYVVQQGWMQDEVPMVQYSLLWQQGELAAVAYAAVTADLVKDYCDVFYEAGLKIKAIDLGPLTVLRSLAASGVLDALLHKIGLGAIWGCFGVSGSQTWVTLWQGTNLLRVGSFTTPADQAGWEDRITEYLIYLGIDKPAIWLAWQEAGMQSPIDPLKLRLKAPVRPVQLGPIYQRLSVQPSLSALGAALKSEITFPLEWDFLAGPSSEPLRAEYSTVPYTNYQPVIPKLFFRLALLVFSAALLGTLFFGGNNFLTNRQLAAAEADAQRTLTEITNQNRLYSHVFQWVYTKTLPGIQVETLRVETPDKLSLTGKGFKKEVIQQYLSNLVTASPAIPLKVIPGKQLITPIEDVPPAFHFDFTAQVVQNGKRDEGKQKP